MTILRHIKRNGVRSGSVLLAGLLWAGTASAEVTLVEKDGWTFTFDGRVGAFLSYTFGENFPQPTPPTNVMPVDPAMPVEGTHEVSGQAPSQGKPSGFGFGSGGQAPHKQANGDNEFSFMRIRSGTIANILGFGLSREVAPGTVASGHIRIWAPIESAGRDAWYPLLPDLREAYLTLDGGWGKFTAGRTYNLLGRISYEIDYEYAHGFTHGLPCSDDTGPSCGQVGAGALHPGFGAGLIYTTPSLGGLTVDLGVFDPVAMGAAYPRATIPRPEGAITFETRLGAEGLVKVSAEGTYQPLSVIQEEDHDNDPATAVQPVETKEKIWGVSGGARFEIGPARVGAAAFHGRGIGLYHAFHATNVAIGPAVEPFIDAAGMPTASLAVDDNHDELREFTGAHGQLAFVFGPAQVGVGGGIGMVGELDSDKINVNLSPPKHQIGLSFAALYHLSDSVVLGLDFMRFMATWKGVPEQPLDPMTGMPITNMDGSVAIAPGGPREGETQTVNFLNAGITYHW